MHNYRLLNKTHVVSSRGYNSIPIASLLNTVKESGPRTTNEHGLISPPATPPWQAPLGLSSLPTLSVDGATSSTTGNVSACRVTKSGKKQKTRKALPKVPKVASSKYPSLTPEQEALLQMQLNSFSEMHRGLPREAIVRAFLKIMDSFNLKKTRNWVEEHFSSDSQPNEKAKGHSNIRYTKEQVDAIIYLLRDLNLPHKYAIILYKALYPKTRANSADCLNSRLYRADYKYPLFENDVPVTEDGRQLWFRVKAKAEFPAGELAGKTLLLKHPERLGMYDFVLREHKEECERLMMVDSRRRSKSSVYIPR